jgi:uncharacterized membrane protein
MANKNDRLVVGLYPNAAAAKTAGENIKEWDEWDSKDIKLGAMAVLTVDPRSGKLHADEIGQRSTKSGMGWGTALGAVVGILSGGIALIPGMIVGAAAGAGVGALNHKSVGMTDEQNARIVDALKHGGAALAVMCDDFEVDPVVAKMADEGGDVSHYDLPEDIAEVITTAAAAQIAATEAIDANVDEEIEEVDVVEVTRVIEAEVPDLEEEHVEHVSKLMAVTGMSAAEAAKLHDAGIEKVSGFLEMAATPDGRKTLSEETGVDEEVILYNAKKLDLMRVKGIGYKYATLLIAAGVDTVPELARRNAANLAEKAAEVNAAEAFVDSLPSEDMVADWVAQAKDLPRMLYY